MKNKNHLNFSYVNNNYPLKFDLYRDNYPALMK